VVKPLEILGFEAPLIYRVTTVHTVILQKLQFASQNILKYTGKVSK